MSIFSDMKARYELMRNGSDWEQKVFAGCELVCQPLSFMVFLAIPVLFILKKCGIGVPHWLDAWAFPILVSAAIGYLTNWIAIEMLFKPYEETRCFPLKYVWKQGLVPRNKGEIARQLGNKIATELLPEDKLADELCEMVSQLLDNPQIIDALRKALQRQVIAHNQSIIAFLCPKIEQGIVGEIDRLLTVENIQKFWDDQITPRLQSEEVRGKIANVLLDTLNKRAPEIADQMRPALIKIISDYCMEKGGMLGPMFSKLVEGLAENMLSQDTIANGITNWVNNPETMPMLRNELVSLVQSIRDYVKSPEVKENMESFVNQMRLKFMAYLNQWLLDNLVPLTEKMLNSDTLWKWLAETISKNRPHLDNFIRTTGMPMIRQKLNIQGRIEEAVAQQDMEQFHGMINDIAAKHLGAIQVLGFVLGGIAGTLMTFVM